jgi:hypothetical protein
MKHSITGNKLTIELDINPQDWWLFNEKSGVDNPDFHSGIWYLARKIDRSYKGKDPDIALPTLTIETPGLLEDLRKLKIDEVYE